jgi:hypothetical protein
VLIQACGSFLQRQRSSHAPLSTAAAAEADATRAASVQQPPGTAAGERRVNRELARAGSVVVASVGEDGSVSSVPLPPFPLAGPPPGTAAASPRCAEQKPSNSTAGAQHCACPLL